MTTGRGPALLSQGITAAKAGLRHVAQQRLSQAAELLPDDPQVWLWLAAMAESPSNALACLESAMALAPTSATALAGVTWYRQLLGLATPAEPSPPLALTVDVPCLYEPETEAPPSIATWLPPPLPTEPFETEFAENHDPQSVEPSAAETPQHEVEARTLETVDRLQSEVATSITTTIAPPAITIGDILGEEPPHSPIETPVAEIPPPVFDEDRPWRPGILTELPHLMRPMADAPSTPLHWAPAAPSADIPEAALEEPAPGVAEAPTPWVPAAALPSTPESSESEVPPSPLLTTNSAAPTVDAWAEEPAVDDEELPPLETRQTVDSWLGRSIVPQQLPQTNRTLDTEPSAAAASDIASQAAIPHDEPASHAVRGTVLIVDDSATVRKLVVMTLEKANYRVIEAVDGVQAIKEIAAHLPGLVLLDINMPGIDGYKLCRLVRSHVATRHIPVVMLSGKGGAFDKLRGRLAGSLDYITKPFEPDALVQKVDRYVLDQAE